jgi:putative peptidoglycan lipid II flippase
MSVVMDAVTIAVITIWAGSGVHAVAWAFVGGAVAQLAFIGVMAARRGFRYRATLGIRDPDVARVGRLLVRPMVGAGLNPLARVGEQLIVSFMPTGSISLLNYGYRLISVIGGGILFRPVIVTILPRLTEATSKGRTDEVREVTRLAVRIMLAISLPLTALAVVLAQPATLVIFRRGSFSGADAALLGTLLATYSLSLVGSAVQRALLAPFYARLETRVPFRNTLYGVCANLALAPPLVLLLGADRPEGIVGVALAYSLAQYVNVAHAWVRLRALGITLDRMWSTIWRLGVVAVVGVAVLVAVDAWLDLGAPEDRWSMVAKLVSAAAAGIAAMTGVLMLVAGRDIRRFRASLRRNDRLAGTHDVVDPGGPTKNLS